MPNAFRKIAAAALVAGILPAVAVTAQTSGELLQGKAAFGDWRTNSPGTRRLIRPQDVPAPDPAAAAANFATIARRTDAQKPSVPLGWKPPVSGPS